LPDTAGKFLRGWLVVAQLGKLGRQRMRERIIFFLGGPGNSINAIHQADK